MTVMEEWCEEICTVDALLDLIAGHLSSSSVALFCHGDHTLSLSLMDAVDVLRSGLEFDMR
jgi:hypothetical protein